MKTLLLKAVSFAVVMMFLTAFDTPAKNRVKPIVSAEADTLPPNTCAISNQTFQDGEEMVFKIYYNWNFVWLSAGEVVFRVREVNQTQYHLSAHGRTYKSYEWFYKVRDNYDTFVDKETLLPILSIRDIQEGKYTLYDKITFDQRRKKAKSLRGRSREKAELTEYDIENCMHDILSIVYFTRNLNFDQMSAGQSFPIKVFVDQKTWPLQVRFKGKNPEMRIKGLGKFKTIQFSPEVVTGFYFKEGDEMNIWVSDDKNKLPLMIESPVSVGSIKAVLKSYKGLRYDLAAQVEKDDGMDDEE